MKRLFAFAAFLGFTSVIIGATGDHALSGIMDATMTERFDVALRYHQINSVLLLALGLYALARDTGRLFRAACAMLAAGAFIFSLSLYLSIFLSAPLLVCGTPVGGMLLMAGWGLLIVWGLNKAIIKSEDKSGHEL